MKLNLALTLSLLLAGGNLFAQTNQAKRLFVPYLDEESQSNVIVTISGIQQPCPPEYTNTLSNTNLFTPEEQKVIADIFIKYKNVTTNSGPPGTILSAFYRTNYVINVRNRTVAVENDVADFKYTNFDAHEQITIKGGLSAKFLNTSGEGYNVFFVGTGNGTMLQYIERKGGVRNGILAEFEDMQWQGTNWDFRRADFITNSHLVEYRQYTNGMVFGKYLMWNPRNNDLFLEADFKQPYDFEKYRTDLRTTRK
jgi:hypothetical protein